MFLASSETTAAFQCWTLLGTYCAASTITCGCVRPSEGSDRCLARRVFTLALSCENPTFEQAMTVSLNCTCTITSAPVWNEWRQSKENNSILTVVINLSNRVQAFLCVCRTSRPVRQHRWNKFKKIIKAVFKLQPDIQKNSRAKEQLCFHRAKPWSIPATASDQSVKWYPFKLLVSLIRGSET